jgi:hypothetical protein
MKRKASINDPHGGLTPAVRAEFARKDGTRLKPEMHLRQGTTYSTGVPLAAISGLEAHPLV